MAVYYKFNKTIKQKRYTNVNKYMNYLFKHSNMLSSWIPFNTIRQCTKPAGHFIHYTYLFHFFFLVLTGYIIV